eukprot:880001-Pyramimonas_sp.AAC.1
MVVSLSVIATITSRRGAAGGGGRCDSSAVCHACAPPQLRHRADHCILERGRVHRDPDLRHLSIVSALHPTVAYVVREDA